MLTVTLCLRVIVNFKMRDFILLKKVYLKALLLISLKIIKLKIFATNVGVKLIVNGAHLQIAKGGGSDLYGACADFDDFSRTGTVVPMSCSFECVLIAKDKTIKAEDKLIINSEGFLEKAREDVVVIHALALGSAEEFKDRRDVYGVKVLFWVKQIKDAI